MNGRNGPGTQDVSKRGRKAIRDDTPIRSRTDGTCENRRTCAKSRQTQNRNRWKIKETQTKGPARHTPFRSRTNETGENRKTCATSRNLETQEELVNAGVVGEFGMERRGENLALAQTDHIAAHRGLNSRGRPDLGHKRSTNEH